MIQRTQSKEMSPSDAPLISHDATFLRNSLTFTASNFKAKRNNTNGGIDD